LTGAIGGGGTGHAIGEITGANEKRWNKISGAQSFGNKAGYTR